MIKIEKKFLKIFLIFGVIYLVVIFFVFFLIKKIEKEGKEILSLERELTILKEKEKFLLNFKSYLNEIFPDLIKIESLFVSKEDPLPFFEFLEKIAKENNVVLEIKSSTIKKEKERSYFIFNLSAISSYPYFFKFLTKLEKGPYLIEITKIVISRIEEENAQKENAKEGDVRADISLKIPTK